MKKIIVLAILLISCTAYGTELAHIEDGESGLSVTNKINELIDLNNSITEPTVQADDPTVSNENGVYFATTSQKMFIKDDDFLWASGVGVYTAITSGYDLTLTMSGVSGLDKVTIAGTDYTATSTITGLSGVVPITATFGDSDTLDATGVTGSYPDYSITMDADGSASFAFSTATTDTSIFHWDASSSDQSSLLVTQEATTITSTGTPPFVTGYDGLGYEPTDGNFVSHTANTNLPESLGTIELWFKHTAGSDISYSAIVDCNSSAWIGRRGGYPTTLRLRPHGTQWDVDTSVTIWDGSWHKIEMSWNTSTNTLKVRVDDGSTITSSGLTLVESSEALMVFGAYIDGTAGGGMIDEVKIYNTDNL